MINAAIAGLGWWGQHVVRSLAGSEHLRIVKAVETNAARAAFAAEHGLQFAGDLANALADPAIDAVILCTPHAVHTEQVLACAAAKKHVFCEKPLALTRADAARSVAACGAAGVVLGIGHERRYEPAIVEVGRLVREGALGTLMHVEANFNHDKLANVPAGDWRASPKDAPAAGMTAMGIHLSDLFVELLGPATQAFAVTTSRVAYPDNGDVVSALIRFESGATGYLNAILVTPHYLCLTVFGSEAWVEVRNETHPDTPGPSVLTLQHRDGRRETRAYQWVNTVRLNLEAFARAIDRGAPYPFTDAEKIGNIAVLEAIYRSAASNAPVRIDSLA
ncbi:MAG: Gfo/Idh/MocA family oxidoreductase [Hyphomicrobiaceae bacterium]